MLEKIICLITEHVYERYYRCKRIYVRVHIITNFSAANNSIQIENDSFNTIHKRILFVKYQMKWSHVQAIRTI